MKKKFIKAAAGLGFAQLALLAGVSAQDTTKVLNDAVVTATKLDQKQSQTGKVISIITREVMDRSQGKTVTQLLSEQAGIFITGAQSNAGKEKSLFFRGAGTAYTPILIDGIQVNDPSIVGAIFDIRLLSIDQIERIEILRGGQSTLYGSDAVAGVINIITKKGGGSPVNVSALAKAGSYGTYDGNLSFYGSANKLSYSLNYSHFHSDGISEAKNLGSSQFDRDRFDQDGLNASVSYAVNNQLTLSPFFRYQYMDSKYDNGAFADAPNISYSHFLTSGFNSVFKTGATKLTLNYSFANTERAYRSSFSGEFKGGMHLADLYVNQKLSDKVQVLAGLENRFIDVKQIGAPVEKPDASLFSAYSSLSFTDLLKYADLELGGRYNNHSDYGSNYTYSVTPSIKFFDGGFRMFGTINTAFKAPTLTELYGAFGANPNLKPQKSDNYEAGFTVTPSNQFTLRVTGFERYLKDAIIYGAEGYTNLDVQDDWGAEIEPSYTGKYFDLKGFYAFVKGTTYSKNASGSFVKSDFLLRRPKHAIGVNLGSKLTEKVYSSINFRNYGKRNDSYFDSSTFTTVNVVNKTYQLLDFYTEYKHTAKLKLFLNVNNVLDSEYQEIAGYSAMGVNFMAGLSYKIK